MISPDVGCLGGSKHGIIRDPATMEQAGDQVGKILRPGHHCAGSGQVGGLLEEMTGL